MNIFVPVHNHDGSFLWCCASSKRLYAEFNLGQHKKEAKTSCFDRFDGEPNTYEYNTDYSVREVEVNIKD